MTTASLVFKFLDKKCAGANISDGVIKSKILSNQRPLHLTMWHLTEKLHKPIIKKIEKQKVCSSFRDIGCSN